MTAMTAARRAEQAAEVAGDMDQPWRDRAACKRTARLMDPPGGLDGDEQVGARNAARKVCDGCPVLAACEAWVMGLDQQDDPGGMCAAMTPGQRKKRRRAVKQAAQPPLPPVDLDGPKRCSRCRETKPRSAFYANRKSPDGRRADCASCATERGRDRARRRRGEAA